MKPRFVLLQPGAPTKPQSGASCNGCGLCCADRPCPLGMVVSGRMRGACAALHWDGATPRYRCGVVEHPGRWLPWLPEALARRLARRWIAAAWGCDSDLQAG